VLGRLDAEVGLDGDLRGLSGRKKLDFRRSGVAVTVARLSTVRSDSDGLGLRDFKEVAGAFTSDAASLRPC